MAKKKRAERMRLLIERQIRTWNGLETQEDLQAAAPQMAAGIWRAVSRAISMEAKSALRTAEIRAIIEAAIAREEMVVAFERAEGARDG